MTQQSLATLLPAGRPDRHPIALRRDAVIDFGRFRADVACVARRMAGCRRAALHCRDSYHFLVGLFGLMQAGTSVVLPPNGQPGTLRALAQRFDRLVDDSLIVMTAVSDGADKDVIEWSPLPTEVAVLHFFTSGSCGEAKCVSKTLGQMERELSALVALWPAAGRRVLATVSHQHLYGLTFKILLPLAIGCPFATETHEVWETLLPALGGDAVVVSSPAHLGRLRGLARKPDDDRPAMVLSAGAPLSVEAATDSEAILGCLPTEIFGSTETGVIATRRQRSAGVPWSLLPGVDMRTDDDGRLSVRAPHVAGTLWLETADRVTAVPGHGYHFRGRVDEVVKVEGKRIDLKEIERALEDLLWVDAAAVTVLPEDPVRLAAVVVPSRQGAEQLARLGPFRFGRLLRRALVQTQEAAGMPRLWRFVAALPVAPMGKRRTGDIRALFGDRV